MDVVFLKFPIEGGAADAQEICGAGEVAPGEFDGVCEVLAFDFFEGEDGVGEAQAVFGCSCDIIL